MSELGKSITAAVRSLRSVQRDISTLVNSLENMMEERDWTTLKRRVSGDNDEIFADLFILFAPKQEVPAALSKAIIVTLEIAPPKPLEEPYLLAGIGWFNPRADAKSVWDDWWSDDSLRVLRNVAASSELVSLSKELRSPHYLPAASRAAAVAVPLCDIQGTKDLEALLVTPLLDASRAAPATNSITSVPHKRSSEG